MTSDRRIVNPWITLSTQGKINSLTRIEQSTDALILSTKFYGLQRWRHR